MGVPPGLWVPSEVYVVIFFFCELLSNATLLPLAIKKGEDSTTIAWVRTKVSFAVLRAALLCLRGSRTLKRRNNLDMGDADLDIEKTQARIH